MVGLLFVSPPPFVGIYPWGLPRPGRIGDPTDRLKGQSIQSIGQLGGTTSHDMSALIANQYCQVKMTSELHMSTCQDSSKAMSTCRDRSIAMLTCQDSSKAMPTNREELIANSTSNVDPSKHFESYVDYLGQVDCQVDLSCRLCMSMSQDNSKAMPTGRKRSIAKSTYQIDNDCRPIKTIQKSCQLVGKHLLPRSV